MRRRILILAAAALLGCAACVSEPAGQLIAPGVKWVPGGGLFIDDPSILAGDDRLSDIYPGLCGLLQLDDPAGTADQLDAAGFETTWFLVASGQNSDPSETRLLDGPPATGRVIDVGSVAGTDGLPADVPANASLRNHLLVSVAEGNGPVPRVCVG